MDSKSNEHIITTAPETLALLVASLLEENRLLREVVKSQTAGLQTLRDQIDTLNAEHTYETETLRQANEQLIGRNAALDSVISRLRQKVTRLTKTKKKAK